MASREEMTQRVRNESVKEKGVGGRETEERNVFSVMKKGTKFSSTSQPKKILKRNFPRKVEGGIKTSV